MELIILLAIAIFVMLYRTGNGSQAYKDATKKAIDVYEKYALYTFKEVTQKTKELGFQYT